MRVAFHSEARAGKREKPMRHAVAFTLLGTQLRGYLRRSAPGRLAGLARNAEYVVSAFFTACLLLFWFPSESGADEWPYIDDYEWIVYECSDGIDNDGDSYVDYPDDPDCADEMDEAERMPTRPWRGSAVFEPLPQPEGLGAPYVSAVSGDGSIVVGAASPGPDPREIVASVIWHDGVAEVIDDVRGMDPNSYNLASAALGISDDGRVIVGYHSYRYEEDGEMLLGARAYRYEDGFLEDLALPDPEIPRVLRARVVCCLRCVRRRNHRGQNWLAARALGPGCTDGLGAVGPERPRN
jgi:hypothetical protein